MQFTVQTTPVYHVVDYKTLISLLSILVFLAYCHYHYKSVLLLFHLLLLLLMSAVHDVNISGCDASTVFVYCISETIINSI